MKTSFIWTTREILFSRLFWFCVLLYPYAWWLAEKSRATSSINQIINPVVTYSRTFPVLSSLYKGLTKTWHVGTGLAVKNKCNTRDSLMLRFNWNLLQKKGVTATLSVWSNTKLSLQLWFLSRAFIEATTLRGESYQNKPHLLIKTVHGWTVKLRIEKRMNSKRV